MANIDWAEKGRKRRSQPGYKRERYHRSGKRSRRLNKNRAQGVRSDRAPPSLSGCGHNVEPVRKYLDRVTLQLKHYSNILPDRSDVTTTAPYAKLRGGYNRRKLGYEVKAM